MKWPLWNQHFKDQLIDWVCPEGVDSNSMEALQLALRDNFISNEEYLSWASHVFQLPILDDKFFDLNTPNEVLWNKTKNFYPWGPYLMPIGNWDNNLIVAGLAPAKYSPEGLHVIYVLASNGCLLKRWTDYHGTPTEAYRILKPVLPTEIPKSIESNPSKNNFDEEFVNNLFHQDMDEAKNDSLVENEIDSNESNDEPINEDKIEDNDDSQESDQLSLMLSETNTTQVKLTKLDSTEFEKKSDLEYKMTSNPVNSSPVNSSPFKNEDASDASGKVDKTYLFDYLFKNHENETTNLILNTFDQMKSYFQKSVFIAINNDETLGKVTHIGIETRGPVNLNFEIDLTTPSLFRIVTKTLKPYHGYVVVNDINEKFFEEFFYGQIPDNVTLTPVVSENHLIGILMGCGEKSTYTKNVLTYQQKISAYLALELSKEIKKSSSVA